MALQRAAAIRDATRWQPRARALSALARVKRFYKEAHVKEVPHAGGVGHGVHLDGRPLKTPAKLPLVFASRPLALAVSHEWGAQRDFILPHTMPLMTLATTSIDQIPTIRPQLEQSMLLYFQSDTVCFRSPDDEDAALRSAEARRWDPLLAWFNGRFGTAIRATAGLELRLSEDDVDKVDSFLAEQTGESIAALDTITVACKSFVIAAAVAEGRLSAEEACAAARLAEDAQIDEWGLAEGSHDIDIVDLRIRVAASSVFAKLSADAGLDLAAASSKAGR